MHKLYLIIAFLAGIAVVFGGGIISSAFHHPRPVVVKLADGSILFGSLSGNTLCNYYIPTVVKNVKTHKPTIQVSTGGAAYGGSGCLEIRESILTVEDLTPRSSLYAQLNK